MISLLEFFMNEWIFFLHSFFVLLFLSLAIKGGKSLLAFYIVLLTLFANMFVIKQITLFSLSVTPSDVYVIGAIIGLNFLQEFYGAKEARKVFFMTLGAFAVFLVMAQIHLAYLPNVFDTSQSHFLRIFTSSPRIFLASIVSMGGVEFLSIALFSFLKKRFGEKYFYARQWSVVFVSQVIDTMLFSFLGLWGIVEKFWHVVVFGLSIKMITILISFCFIGIYFSKVIGKKKRMQSNDSL
ncbi:MAG: queuosine precursor transporter [Parachlamydiales bacterium]|nr:queuosine precursor transporter [Parachlamydiales bacterium]